MLTLSEMNEHAAALAVPVVAGVGDDRLDDPTPCSDFTVRELLEHLFVVVTEFERSARGEDMDFTPREDFFAGDWRTDFARRVEALRRAWDDPEALTFPSQMLPRHVTARLPGFDLTVHGWDLATATGQPYSVPDELTAAVEETCEAIGTPMMRESGMFGVPVPVAADAVRFDRLLGSLGRDPGWTRTA